MIEREKLEQAIADLEGQRVILGDDTVDAAITGLRQQLNALKPEEKESVPGMEIEMSIWPRIIVIAAKETTNG